MEVFVTALSAKLLNQMLDKYFNFPKGHHCVYILRIHTINISTMSRFLAKTLHSYILSKESYQCLLLIITEHLVLFWKIYKLTYKQKCQIET